MGAALLLFLAISVKHDGTHLREGCASGESTIATLAAGTPVQVKFAVSGESTPCYKVAAEAGGRSFAGYLSAEEIEGLETFEQARREAAWLDPVEVMKAVRASAKNLAQDTGAAGTATRLIERGQPGKALEILQPEIERRKDDPGLLALAGLAAWRADDGKQAVEYWRGSLALQPNAALESLVRRVERENRGDRSTDKLIGTRVVLRYDGAAVPADTARAMLGALEAEYSRISQDLGCTAEERIVAIVQSEAAYRQTTNAAEWNGGQFDGRIRVPVLGGQGLDAAMRRTLAHETVHACLAMLGTWPAWLHEGLAQKFSGESLTAAARQTIAEMTREHRLPRLENLAQDWSRMDRAHAVAAYGLSLDAVEALLENYHEDGLANLLRNPEKLNAITADLDRRLGL